MKLLIAILILILPLGVYSNGDPVVATSSINGIVTDNTTNEVLTGVRVSIKGTDVFTFTEEDGSFKIDYVPAGKIELSFSLVSFETDHLELDLTSGNVSSVEFTLRER